MTTKLPTIELRRISHNERLSQETNAFAADLYVDGVKWGEIDNDGWGGGDRWHPMGGKTLADWKALSDLLAANLPQRDTGMADPKDPTKPFMMEQDLEAVTNAFLTDWLIAKDLTRTLKRQMLFTKAGQAGVYQIPLVRKGVTRTVESIVAALERQGAPAEKVLNLLPFEEALAIYKAAA